MTTLKNLSVLVYSTPDITSDTTEPLWKDSIVLFSDDPADMTDKKQYKETSVHTSPCLHILAENNQCINKEILNLRLG